jgi:AcrR family transcriptional regulator
VTVHRKFAGKAGLVRAVVVDDIQRFAHYAESLWSSEAPAADRLVEACAVAVIALRRNPLFNTLLRSEPEELLKQLSLDGEEIFELACGVLAARLREHVDSGELPKIDVALTAELIVRLGFSVVLLPFGVFPGEREDDIRRQVRSAIMPIVLGQQPTG